MDPWNLRRVVEEHGDRTALARHVRRQAGVLCGVAEQLSQAARAVLVPTLLLSGDEVLVDQPVSLAGLLEGLAGDHLPGHTQQLVDMGTRP